MFNRKLIELMDAREETYKKRIYIVERKLSLLMKIAGYTECPRCSGHGKLLTKGDYGHDRDCTKCDGDGYTKGTTE